MAKRTGKRSTKKSVKKEVVAEAPVAEKPVEVVPEPKKSTKKCDNLLHKINNICRILPVGCELDKQKWVLYNDFINIYGRICYV